MQIHLVLLRPGNRQDDVESLPCIVMTVEVFEL
jgi:hypothetical protein